MLRLFRCQNSVGGTGKRCPNKWVADSKDQRGLALYSGDGAMMPMVVICASCYVSIVTNIVAHMKRETPVLAEAVQG
jgi:hypothetical protein